MTIYPGENHFSSAAGNTSVVTDNADGTYTHDDGASNLISINAAQSTASSGLYVDALSGDVRLGSAMLEDVVIDDPSNTHNLGFVGMNSVAVLGVNQFSLQSLGSTTLSSAITTIASTTSMNIITPAIAASTATTGQVLTLINQSSGTAEWQDIPAVTASNGLSVDGATGDLKLGDVLTEATTIDLANFDFNINVPTPGQSKAFSLYSDTNFFGTTNGGMATGYGQIDGEVYFQSIGNFGGGYQLSNGWTNQATGAASNLNANSVRVQIVASDNAGNNSSVRATIDQRVQLESSTGIYEFINAPVDATSPSHVVVYDSADNGIKKMLPADIRPFILSSTTPGAVLISNGTSFEEASYVLDKIPVLVGTTATLNSTPAPGFFQLFKDSMLLVEDSAGTQGYSRSGISITFNTPLTGSEELTAYYYSY